MHKHTQRQIYIFTQTCTYIHTYIYEQKMDIYKKYRQLYGGKGKMRKTVEI